MKARFVCVSLALLVSAPAVAAPLTELESSMHDLVQERGFNCANLLSVARTLDNEFGQNWLVTCYFGGRGATYRVTIRPNHTILVKVENSY